MFETATLRSGYSLNDQVGFAERIEGVGFFNFIFDLLIFLFLKILRKSLDLSPTAEVEDELELIEDETEEKKEEEGVAEEEGVKTDENKDEEKEEKSEEVKEEEELPKSEIDEEKHEEL